MMADGYRIVERERRHDPANPNADERTPLLVMSPGSLTPAPLEAGDAAPLRGIGYGGIRFGSPRS
jgi:hypothetical protein